MSKDNKSIYHQFSNEQSWLPLFMKPWFLDAIVGEANWDVVLVERKNKIIAVMPFTLQVEDGQAKLTTPNIIPYLGPWLIPSFQEYDHQHKYLFHLIDQLPEFALFQQSFHHSITNWLPFYWNQFQQTTYYKYEVDLSRSMETIHLSMNPDYRLNKISNARRFVRTVFNRTIEDFFHLHQNANDRNPRTNLSSEQLFKLYDVLIKHNAGKLFFTVDGLHQSQSACLLAWDQHTAYLLCHALNADTAYPDALVIVIWEALHYARNILNLSRIELLGAMDKSTEQLYRGFGTKQVPYFHITK